jgi:diguanylate cyclase (GGDEF)-like protein
MWATSRDTQHNNKDPAMNPMVRNTADTELSQFRVQGEIPVPVLINWLTAAAIPILFFFAWRAALRDAGLATPYILLGFAGLLGVNMLAYLLIGNRTLQRRGFITVITVLFTYLAIRAVEDGSAVIWLFAYPPVVFYICESRVGVIACGAGLAGLMLLFSPIGDVLFESPYSPSFRLSMIVVLAFEMVTCYILDQSRRRSKLGLLKLAAEFEHAAKHDALTGLANRREALHQLENEYERYLRNDRPFSVLLMDIDLFKNVNDSYGHQAGDQLIKLVAQTLVKQCRKVDTLARWGGEEYLVLLPEAGPEEAWQTAERIRKSIAAATVKTNQHTLSATVSVGVATLTNGETIDRLLQRADEALYQAKRLGRNRVCKANP